jgi:3-oxoadipate enol-lactonase
MNDTTDRLAYDTWGPTDGIPTIQLHGLTSSRARDVALGLDLTAGQDDLHVLRYDAPGHGQSPGPFIPAAYRWTSLARNLEDMLGHFGGVPVHAVGQSMGSATILTSAAGDPEAAVERYGSFVLGLPPTAWELRGDRAGTYERSARFVEEHGRAAFAETTRYEPAPQARRSDIPFTYPDVTEELLPTVFRGAAGNDLPPREKIAALGEKRIPTLILSWAGDVAHPVAVAEELHELLPNSQLVTAYTPEDSAKWPDMIGSFIRTQSRYYLGQHRRRK